MYSQQFFQLSAEKKSAWHEGQEGHIGPMDREKKAVIWRAGWETATSKHKLYICE